MDRVSRDAVYSSPTCTPTPAADRRTSARLRLHGSSGASVTMDQLFGSVFQAQWVVFALPAVLLVGFAELGFRLGLRLYLAKDTARKGEIGGIQGAQLSLLGLLPGFTFVMAIRAHLARLFLWGHDPSANGPAFMRPSL